MPAHRRRAVPAILTTLFALALLAPPAAAREAPRAPGLADQDRDGLSDNLEARLARRPADAMIPVIVTFDGPGGVRSATRSVGAFEVVQRFGLVDGFAGVMTRAQAEALAALPGVFRVEPDFLVEATIDAADRDFGTEAARATYGVTGEGVEVCVVDTGVDPATSSSTRRPRSVRRPSPSTTPSTAGPRPTTTTVTGPTSPPSPSATDPVVPMRTATAGSHRREPVRRQGAELGGLRNRKPDHRGIDWCARRPSVRVISMSLGARHGPMARIPSVKR